MINCWGCYKFLHRTWSFRLFGIFLDKGKVLYVLNLSKKSTFDCQWESFYQQKNVCFHMILNNNLRYFPYNSQPFKKGSTKWHFILYKNIISLATLNFFLFNFFKSLYSFQFLSFYIRPHCISIYSRLFCLSQKKMFHHHKLTNFCAINLHTWATMAYTQSHSYLIWH